MIGRKEAGLRGEKEGEAGGSLQNTSIIAQKLKVLTIETDSLAPIGENLINQIKSLLLVYGVNITINDQGVVWVYGKGH